MDEGWDGGRGGAHLGRKLAGRKVKGAPVCCSLKKSLGRIRGRRTPVRTREGFKVAVLHKYLLVAAAEDVDLAGKVSCSVFLRDPLHFIGTIKCFKQGGGRWEQIENCLRCPCRCGCVCCRLCRWHYGNKLRGKGDEQKKNIYIYIYLKKTCMRKFCSERHVKMLKRVNQNQGSYVRSSKWDLSVTKHFFVKSKAAKGFFFNQ